MKTRHGFVSNSSSSSFIIVGVYAQLSDRKFLEAGEYEYLDDKEPDDDKFPAPHMGYGDCKGLALIGSDYLDMIGIDAEQMIEEDMRISEIAVIFKAKALEVGFDIGDREPFFSYGEAGNG